MHRTIWSFTRGNAESVAGDECLRHSHTLIWGPFREQAVMLAEHLRGDEFLSGEIDFYRTTRTSTWHHIEGAILPIFVGGSATKFFEGLTATPMSAIMTPPGSSFDLTSLCDSYAVVDHTDGTKWKRKLPQLESHLEFLVLRDLWRSDPSQLPRLSAEELVHSMTEITQIMLFCRSESEFYLGPND